MQEIYIGQMEAARLENMKLSTFSNRIQRNRIAYVTRLRPRPGGGRPLREISVSSLSPAAQERYWKEQSETALEDVEPENTVEEKRWYETIDRGQYRRMHMKEYAEKAELVHRLRACMETSWGDRQKAYDTLANELGLTRRAVQGYAAELIDADRRAQRYQAENDSKASPSMEFQTLALCRKPRAMDAFPQLTERSRALIENIYADKEFARNHPTRELITDRFMDLAKEYGIEELPSRYAVKKYLKHLSGIPEYRDAHNLIALGRREYENKCGLKTRRDTSQLKVLEVVMGDVHNLDLWAELTNEKGQRQAIRPALVAWIDVKSRRIMGALLCRSSNFDVLKESFFKMVYREAQGIPKILYIDNGKDYTSKAMMGQTKKERREHSGASDAAANGYYHQMGVREINVAIPYHPWSKGQIERSFGTLCNNFSKLFTSYTGTLTGSKTENKIPKDIEKMLANGELLNIDEVQQKLDAYLERYHHRVSSALSDAGETWRTPMELFEKGERYKCAPPPKEYAIELMKQDCTATVRNTGICLFKRRYFTSELAPYIGYKVNVKYDPDDKSKLSVYERETGKFICEAKEAQSMSFGDYLDTEALAEHRQMQNRQIKSAADTARRLQTQYTERVTAEPKRRTQSLEGLMYAGSGKSAPEKAENVVALPQDREYSGGLEERQMKRKKAGWLLDKDASATIEYLNTLPDNREAF